CFSISSVNHHCIEDTLPPSSSLVFFLMKPPPPGSTLFPYTTLFRSSTWEGEIRICSPSRTRGELSESSVRAYHSAGSAPRSGTRSEEHTSELQSRENLVCRLLLEKKKNVDILWDLLLVTLQRTACAR